MLSLILIFNYEVRIISGSACVSAVGVTGRGKHERQPAMWFFWTSPIDDAQASWSASDALSCPISSFNWQRSKCKHGLCITWIFFPTRMFAIFQQPISRHGLSPLLNTFFQLESLMKRPQCALLVRVYLWRHCPNAVIKCISGHIYGQCMVKQSKCWASH